MRTMLARRIGWLAVAAGLCGLALVSPARRAHAEDDPAAGPERILGIDSEIHVLPDGSLRVRETIQIRSTGRQFKHGLKREFPQAYAGPFGSRSRVGFRVEEVLRDGEAEPFDLGTSDDSSDVVIRAGDPHVLLTAGQHTYRITYVTDRQLGFFADHDELYWHAVGTRWRLPVEQATATVELPPAAQGQIRAVDAYIGGRGSRERAKRAMIEPSRAVFVAGRTLNPGEGMSIVVTWPKGIVREPRPAERFGWWLRDNRDIEIAVFGLILLAVFVRTARQRLRSADQGPRHPGGGPTYEGLASAVSPCLLRYIVHGGFDDRSLPVAILDMAEGGCVTIQQTGAHYRVDRTDQPLDKLPPEEQSAAQALFAEKNQVELAPIDKKRLMAASLALKWDLDRLAPSYLADGRSPATWGVVLSLVIVGAMFGFGSGDWHLGVIAAGIYSGFAFAFFATAGWLARTLTGRQLARTRPGGIVLALILAAGLAGVEIAIAKDLAAGDMSPLAVALTPAVLFLGYRAARLRRLRNRAGEALYQDARRARGERVAAASRAGGGGVSRLLPYAMALDAVTTWEAGLGDLPRAPDAPVIFYPPWYYGDPSWNRAGATWQLSSFTDDFSSLTAQAATPPPGSSSGSPGSSDGSASDGGGSSGGDGGGGGGGGGGW